MKKLILLTTTMLLLFVFAFSSYAETKLTVKGQLRTRGEGVQKSFDPANEHIVTYGYLRTRVNIFADVAENASGFVQFQDSRMYGAGTQSGTTNSSENVDIHQAYLKFNLWTKKNWSIGVQGGRFEYTWGNQRLLGSVGWSNVGRSWEGSLLWYDTRNFSVTLGSLKKFEDPDVGYDGDFDIFTLALNLKEMNLEFLVLIEDNKDTTFATIGDLQALQRATFAAYYKRKMEQIDMHFNFALQGGTMAVGTATEIDIAAMMFTGELGYSFEGDKNARVAIGIDYASGDDGSDSTESTTFNNLYWTGHKFNGFMDYFLGGGPNGLMDVMLRGKLDFTRGWTVGADLHMFTTAEEYSISPTETSKSIGTELDIFVKTTRVKGVVLQFGASAFTASDDFVGGMDKQDGLWSYTQATMNF